MDVSRSPALGTLTPMLVAEVSVNDLHTRLGISTPIDYPIESLTKPLTNWKMEIDDAPIFRYLYRNLRPQRHLEFGTWQGTGVRYCLEECDATVWTINLLAGEVQADNTWRYSNWKDTIASRLFQWARKRAHYAPNWVRGRVRLPQGLLVYQSDSIGSIGKFYLEAGLGHRVCQIYCDSRDWDISNYPAGFFDSVLIDGGHTTDVVTSDTFKACQVVRPGGIVMWHDFCPLPEVQRPDGMGSGVLRAIENLWPRLCREMSDIFWIRPSWILIGIKR